MQQVARIIRKACFNESKQLKKVMLDLNTSRKEIQIFERFKLHRQNVILTESRREDIKFS